MKKYLLHYSTNYYDPVYEYKDVRVPLTMLKRVPRDRLMTEEEWRRLGIKLEHGWEHYMIYCREPHILLFRRKKTEGDEKNDV
ncbi:cyclin-dependent kinases regulatory subunit [Bicyclus anynana]|uniref:Cyclin-dependent kinases regulatory subunit n=1 Tax=Bicyclus anynana TaxID=110368 RepID=A0A6J1MXZ6_BICAN|nr:cyclin-dependent kinases regulatory subunit [Bicyclus anynana]